MCGIYCSILVNCSKTCASHNEIENVVKSFLVNRGPDKQNLICVDNIVFAGFVLWQQGDKICSQPAVNDLLILLFNGDILNDSKRKHTGMSDTTWIINELKTKKSDAELCQFFKTLKGPFSIIFYNKESKNIYFARDSLGRNSLLVEKDEQHFRILSTTSSSACNINRTCIELPPLGLFKLNTCSSQSVTVYPWVTPSKQWREQADALKLTMKIELSIGSLIQPNWLYLNKKHDESYNLYSMAKIAYTSIDDLFCQMIKNPGLSADLEIFSKLLEHSVRERVTNTPKYCANCIKSLVNECHHSKIGILFSGGIDCTILAVLANKFVDHQDSIDLINVAFESVNQISNDWNVPDRCSSKTSLTELHKICPYRKWNFIEVNVSRNDFNYKMQHHIKHLIYPRTTVLDESIGAAFWFASEGSGINNKKHDKSSARVIIVGSGADELFGGYTRHRNAYRRCNGSHEDKEMQVLLELEKDWERIPSRNLGRDDRVISDNGKTSRAPFIEENVVKFIRSRNPSQRCCYLLENGIGDKLFLRLFGYTLGLNFAVSLKKRAIQFGSRIANKNQNANDVSEFFMI